MFDPETGLEDSTAWKSKQQKQDRERVLEYQRKILETATTELKVVEEFSEKLSPDNIEKLEAVDEIKANLENHKQRAEYILGIRSDKAEPLPGDGVEFLEDFPDWNSCLVDQLIAELQLTLPNLSTTPLYI